MSSAELKTEIDWLKEEVRNLDFKLRLLHQQFEHFRDEVRENV